MLIVILKFISEIIIVSIPIFLSLPKKWLHFEALSNFREEHSIALIIVLVVTIALRYLFDSKIKNYKRTIRKLEDTVTAYQTFMISSIEELLKETFVRISFGDKDRITLFLYSSSTNKFYFAGRYASSPKYRKKGRSVLENEKEYVYTVLNEESGNHHKNAPQLKNGFFDKRNMESNSMYGVSIWDQYRDLKIGVVIFQSTRENAYRTKKVRKELQDSTKEIEVLVNRMKINPSILPTKNKPLKGF